VDTWLTVPAVATLAKVSRRTVYAWIASGKVTACRLPTRRCRILASSVGVSDAAPCISMRDPDARMIADLRQWLTRVQRQRSKQRAPAPTVVTPPAPPPAPPPAIEPAPIGMSPERAQRQQADLIHRYYQRLTADEREARRQAARDRLGWSRCA